MNPLIFLLAAGGGAAVVASRKKRRPRRYIPFDPYNKKTWADTAKWLPGNLDISVAKYPDGTISSKKGIGKYFPWLVVSVNPDIIDVIRVRILMDAMKYIAIRNENISFTIDFDDTYPYDSFRFEIADGKGNVSETKIKTTANKDQIIDAAKGMIVSSYYW